MKILTYVIGVCLATMICGTGCTATRTAERTVELRGIATYRERMLLPPGATLEVTVEEVSRADAPATILGRATVNSPGAPPIPFTVAYTPRLVQPGGRYGVRARVLVDNQLIFTTNTFNALPSPGDTMPLSLLMVSVRGASSTAELVNTLWRLLELGDQPVKHFGQQREPSFVLRAPVEGARRVTGFSGCNSMFGTYTLEGDKLSFTQLGGTRMACAQGMDTETAFHAALGRVTRWAIRGEQLDLFDAAGSRVAVLESLYLQ